MSKAFGAYLFSKYLTLEHLSLKTDLTQYPSLQITKKLGEKDSYKTWNIVYEFYMVSLHDYVSPRSTAAFQGSWVCLALSTITGVLYSRCVYTYNDFRQRGFLSNKTLSEHLCPFKIKFNELCPTPAVETYPDVVGSFWSDSPELTDRQWLTRRFMDFVKEKFPDWEMPQDIFEGGLFNDGGVHFIIKVPPPRDEKASQALLARSASKAIRK